MIVFAAAAVASWSRAWIMHKGASSPTNKLGHGASYRYSHDEPSGIAAQQYAPDAVAGKQYYRPTSHGREASYAESLAAIRKALGRPEQ